MNLRTETDSMGKIDVPADRYWGAQTQRSLKNFNIGRQTMPGEVVQAFAVLKKACARVNFNLGLLDEKKCQAIIKACDEILKHQLDEHFPLKIFQTGSGTQTNMNVNEVIANRSHELLGGRLDDTPKSVHPNDDVNRSQSSNDTFPTAMNMAAYQLLSDHTIPALEELHRAFQEKSDAWKKIVKIGRTHLMDATPLTLGQEFSGYAAILEKGLAHLENSLPHLAELAIGGTAVGTGLNAPEGFGDKVALEVAGMTGFPFISAPNKFEALSAHDAIVSTHGALKTIAAGLMKIANDIRFLGSGPRCGIGELILPANEPGSSIMPGKVNPTQAEALTMACAQVMGNDVTIGIAGASGHFELNVFKPVMISNFLESAQLLGDSAGSFCRNCIRGLEPDREKIAHYLENSLMLVTALTPHIGYDKAARIAKKAHKEKITLKQAALELKFVTQKEFEAWIDPIAMTKS